MQVNTKLLAKFNNISQFNSQFSKASVYIAYHGDNRNYSSISKDVFEDMIPSLYGIPVVGEWRENVENEDGGEFGSHGGKIEISEDGIKYIETTKPIGFVGQDAEVYWETITEENGDENEYLVASPIYLWSGRYPEAETILKNQNAQSMEIEVLSGNLRDDDYYEIKKAEFSALCVLGSVEPCFESAGFKEFNLDKDEFKAEFTQMVNELRKSLNFTKQDNTDDIEGGENMEDKDKKIDEEVEETETVEKTDEGVKAENDTGSVQTNDKDSSDEEVFTKTFELSHDDIRCKLYELLSVVEQEDEEWYYIVEVYDNYMVYSSWDSPKYYKQGYVKTDVDVAFEGERVELFVEFLTAEEVKELKKMRKDYSTMIEELEDLREFKAQKDKEEFEAEQKRIREKKIEHINTEYANISKDIKELFISKVDEYETIEDIDADICVYIVKNKVTFSKAKGNKDSSVVKVKVEEEQSNKGVSPYGNLF